MPPRSSKRLKRATNDEDKENAPVTTTSRRRSFKKSGNAPNTTLADCPFDVVLEVAGHLHPLDVYNLAHVNKTLYDTLMSRSSIGAWRCARRNLEGFPEPLEGVAEPKWVHLVYIRICHFCWGKTVKEPDFYLRCRVCPSCAQDKLIGYDPAVEAHPEDKEKISQIFAVIPNHRANYHGRKERTQFALLSEYNAAEQHMGLDWEAYAPECAAMQAKIRAHAIVCEKWRAQCVSQREADLNEMKKNRETAIRNKLTELGYADDLKYMKDFDSMSFDFRRHPRVKATGALTTRVWNNIQDEMIEFMERVRARRMEREHAVVVYSRKRVAASVLRSWLKQPNRIRPTKLYPSVADFCAFKEIHAILDQPNDVVVNAKSFSAIFPHIGELAESWREGVFKQLGKVITGQDDMHPDAALQAAELARNVLLCVRCSSVPDPEDQRHLNRWRKHGWPVKGTPLFYPETLTHKCCSSGHVWGYNKGIRMPVDDAIKLSSINDPYRSNDFGRKEWKAGCLRTQEVLTTIVRKVIRLAGLDPKTATVEDMDRRNRLFECKWCPMETGSDVEDYEEEDFFSGEDHERLPDRLFYNWRLYVEHVFCEHYFDYEDMKSHVEIIGGNEDDELPDGYRVGDTASTNLMYECIHCRCRSSEMLEGWAGDNAVISHITSNHAIEDPEEDVDYCLKYGQPETARQEKVYLFDDNQGFWEEAFVGVAAAAGAMVQMMTLALLARRRR